MARRSRRKRPTLRGLQKYIRKVDVRDRPPIKAVLQPARTTVELNFGETLLLHKWKAEEAPVAPLVLAHAQYKYTTNTDENRVNTDVGNLNVNAVTMLGSQQTGRVITLLECFRPLLYEPTAYIDAMCEDEIQMQGTRQNRQIRDLIIAGEFTIRLIEGENDPAKWYGGLQLDAMGNHKTYGKDGFGSEQFVRAMLLKVTDMGQGYGAGKEQQVDTIQLSGNPNYRNDDSTGQQIGTASNADAHLLAPALGEIFQGVQIDQFNDYKGPESLAMYRNENLLEWKYTSNKDGATPYSGTYTRQELFDPLRGAKQRRKFHVLIDKKIRFIPRGTTSDSMNQQGARQHTFKWSTKLRGLRCQMHHETAYQPAAVPPLYNRTREQLSTRLIWYFMPSISPALNGKIDEDETSAHHAFSVSRGEEKCFWTEKEDS